MICDLIEKSIAAIYRSRLKLSPRYLNSVAGANLCFTPGLQRIELNQGTDASPQRRCSGRSGFQFLAPTRKQSRYLSRIAFGQIFICPRIGESKNLIA